MGLVEFGSREYNPKDVADDGRSGIRVECVPHSGAAHRGELHPAAGNAVMMLATSRRSGGPARSLYEYAAQEADRHKWLVSERLGRDGGWRAWSEWWEMYWPAFCRHRRLEHLRGEARWKEFEDDAFGRFYDLLLAGDLLLDRILDRVAEGWENLEFACWVQEWGLPRDRVVQILEVVNINMFGRLEPKRS